MAVPSFDDFDAFVAQRPLEWHLNRMGNLHSIGHAELVEFIVAPAVDPTIG